ncbi:hypothetical protein V6N13_002869 [Hibiscus sabdariffa]
MLFHAETGSLNGTLVGEENAVALPVPSSSQEQAAEALRAGLHSESDKDSTGSEKQEGLVKHAELVYLKRSLSH